MNFNQLENFLCVCEELSFTKASHKLYVSQPALSQQISRLDQEIGVPLFHRSGSSLQLLPSGVILRSSANRILNEYYLALNNIKGLNLPTTPEVLNIAITKPRAFLLMSYVLPRFYEKYPDIQVVVNEVDSFEVEPLLLDGSVDMGFCNPPEYMPLKKKLIFNEQLLIAVPKNHPINDTIFQYAQTFFKTYHVEPVVRIVTHAGEYIHFLTAANLGLSFVFEMSISLQTGYQDPPVYYSLPHRPYSKPWYLAYRDDTVLTETMRLFTEYNAQCFEKYPF